MEDAQLAQILSGLEQRLSRQLTQDRQTIISALNGGAAPAAAGSLTGPIVLLPEEHA